MTVEDLVKRFVSHPSDMSRGAGHMAKRYHCTKEDIRQARENARAILHGDELVSLHNHISKLEEKVIKFEEDFKNKTATLDYKGPKEVKTKEDLIRECEIDLSQWEITKMVHNAWGKEGNQNYQVKAWLIPISLDTSLSAQKDFLLEELKKDLAPVEFIKYDTHKNKYAYEINVPDVHFGKLAWAEEAGENYNLKIAETRYNEAISHLLSYVDYSKLERIIFPIGNDMINIDSRKNETYAGTAQDSDSRFFKIVQAVKRILIHNINSLSLIAPVDVIVVSGNHDPEAMFMIGEILDAYYHSNPNVSVDNSAKQRKYYKYGKNGFQYTHGNEEKHSDLGLIFATEQARLWADTEFRFCKLGHYHKSKRINYVSIDEHQGFQVQILPSLSGSDAWHASKGYMSKKGAKGFLYDKQEGQVGEFTYNV